MIIDIHAHVIPSEILHEANPVDAWRPRVFRDAQGKQKVDRGGKVIGSAIREFVDIDRIIAEQQAAAVDVLAISPWSSLFNYAFSPDEGQLACRLQNDAIARMVGAYPRQLAGMGMVPLQDARLAVKEAEYIAHDLGMHAIEIGTNINSAYLGDESLLPFWEAIASLDLFVFVHPVEGIGGAMVKQYYLWNLFGNPSETALTTASLILNGTLERFPSLKICMAHGGGSLPYIIGRLDRGYEVRPEAKAKITRPPSTYLRQLYFDTITHSAEALRYLIQLVGADHVLLGSDYPFDMGYERPRDLVDGLNLPAEQSNAILGATAARLLSI